MIRIVTTLVALMTVMCLLLSLSSCECFAGCGSPENGAVYFDDNDDELENPFVNMSVSDNQCRALYGDYYDDPGIAPEVAVMTRATPLPDDGFSHMDTQYVTCDDKSMIGYAVALDEDSNLTSTALCGGKSDRTNRYAVTKRTSYADEGTGMLPHELSCGDAPIVGIGFESRSGQVRCRYDCAQDVVTDDKRRRTFFTGWATKRDDGDGIRSTLSSHTVKCPTGTVLTGLRARACSLDDSRTLVYDCEPVDVQATAKKVDRLSRNQSAVRRADPAPVLSKYVVSDLIDKEPETVFDKLENGIRPLTNASIHVNQHVERAALATDRAFTSAQMTLGKVGTKAASSMSRVGDVVGSDVSKAIVAVGQGFRAVGTATEKVRDAAADAGYQTIKVVGQSIVRPITRSIESVGDSISGAFTSVSDAFPGDSIKKKMSAHGEKLAVNTTCVLADPVKNVGNFVMPAIRAGKEGVNAVGDFFTGKTIMGWFK